MSKQCYRWVKMSWKALPGLRTFVPTISKGIATITAATSSTLQTNSAIWSPVFIVIRFGSYGIWTTLQLRWFSVHLIWSLGAVTTQTVSKQVCVVSDGDVEDKGASDGCLTFVNADAVEGTLEVQNVNGEWVFADPVEVCCRITHNVAILFRAPLLQSYYPIHIYLGRLRRECWRYAFAVVVICLSGHTSSGT